MEQLKSQKDPAFTILPYLLQKALNSIPADQIVRCEADDNYTYLFLKNKTRIIACPHAKRNGRTTTGFFFFIRVHHSYLVNLNEVTKYVRGEGGYLSMTDGSYGQCIPQPERGTAEAFLKNSSFYLPADNRQLPGNTVICPLGVGSARGAGYFYCMKYNQTVQLK